MIVSDSPRRASGLPTIDSIRQDLRYTFRALGRDRAFTTFAVLIVGLGIGASSTVFSIVNTLLLRPLPFRDPARLVWIANHNGEDGDMSGATTQVNHFLDLREPNRLFWLRPGSAAQDQPHRCLEIRVGRWIVLIAGKTVQRAK